MSAPRRDDRSPALGPGPSTLPELLAWRAALHPDRVAVEVHGLATMTFQRWERGARAIASALRRHGLAPGERVGLVFGLRDWVDFALAYCGVVSAGGVAVPLSDRLADEQLRRALGHCSASAVLHSGPPPAGGTVAWTSTVADLLPRGDPTDGTAPVEPGDLAQILYTSGTTGEPKGVAATHANLTFGAPTHPRRLPLAHSRRFLHAFGVGTNAAQTMLLNALTAAPSALTLPLSTPARFARLIEAPGVGTVFLVPSMAVELLDSGALDGVDSSGLHLIGSTAAPLPPPVAARLARVFPNATIVNYYTSTEAAPAQTAMIFDPERPGALGRAVTGELRVTDAEGTPVPAGTNGEVWLRSPYPRHYFGDDGASAATFRDGWVRMGDLGRLDEAGYLYLSDRESDVVKSGAHKVSTMEVEAVLHEHPHIAEAAVVGVPHPVLGTSLAAVIVTRREAPEHGVTLATVRQFLLERLADYQVPSQVLLVDHLPRNEAGKVLKRQLVTRLGGPPPSGDRPREASGP